MQVRESISTIIDNDMPLNEAMEFLCEFFDSPIAGYGALSFANHAVNLQKERQPNVVRDYGNQPAHYATSPEMTSYDRHMITLMDKVLQMLQRCHQRANQVLESLGVRYEIKGAIPQLNSLHTMTTTPPDMINLNIELRDVHFPRRLTQVVKYRISSAMKHKQISLRIMDAKLALYPPKAIFHLNSNSIDFDIRKFEERLTAKLIDRAKRAFKRNPNEQQGIQNGLQSTY